MKQQLNIRISAPGWAKLAALTAKYGSQTIVTELAIDRLYQKEIGMEIEIWLDDDGIIGNADDATLAVYDMNASIERLTLQVLDRVQSAYPKAHIVIHHCAVGPRYPVRIDGCGDAPENEADIESIQELIGQAMAGDWEVYRENAK